MPPVALTIAGSDPSGGAGLQADLKVFHQHGVYGAAAVTLLTVQNTRGVRQVVPVDAALVEAQIRAVLEDIPPQAAKTGALGSAAVVEAVARALAGTDVPLVVDPVMFSKHGQALLDAQGRAALRERLVPRAALVTPNLPEAAALADIAVDDLPAMRRAAERIAAAGARAVLVKGGHLPGEPVDVLCVEGRCVELRAARVFTRHTHGSGCVYSAAITARLARGEALEDAVRAAHRYVTAAIASAPGLGAGSGPLNLLAAADPVRPPGAAPRAGDAHGEPTNPTA